MDDAYSSYFDPGGDWEARYEIWSLVSDRNIFSLPIRLPAPDVVPLLFARRRKYNEAQDSRGSMYMIEVLRNNPHWSGWEGSETVARDPEFERCLSFSAAIGEDLRRVLCLDRLICISVPETTTGLVAEQPSATWTLQRLGNIGGPSEALYVALRTDLSFHNEFRHHFHAKFSTSGEYVCVIRESKQVACKEDKSYGMTWSLAIYRDHSFDNPAATQSSYSCVVNTIFFSFAEITVLSPTRGVVFHPTHPRLAFPQVVDGLPQTYIWDFENPVVTLDSADATDEMNPFPVHDPPLIDPCFADDGVYLYGTDAPIEYGSTSSKQRVFCSPFVVKVPPPPKPQPSAVDPSQLSRVQSGPLQDVSQLRAAVTDLARQAKPVVQHANTLVFDEDRAGVVHISHLRHLERQDAIVLRSFGSDGTLETKTLHRLPVAVRESLNVALVDPGGGAGVGGDRDVVKIVLNKAQKRLYSIEDVDEQVLPAVIERDKESVPDFWDTWIIRKAEFDPRRSLDWTRQRRLGVDQGIESAVRSLPESKGKEADRNVPDDDEWEDID